MSAKTMSVLLCFVAGGLVGTGLALCYTPSSGKEIRNRLEMKSEMARIKTAELADRARELLTFPSTGLKEQEPA